jgi:hypothetical protein
LEKVAQVDFGVFVATPDDILIKRGDSSATIRDNVLFEYGLFAGHLGLHSALLLQLGPAELPTDLNGIHFVRTAVSPSVRDIGVAVNECIDQLLRPLGISDCAFHELRHGLKHIPVQDVIEMRRVVAHTRIRNYDAAELSVEEVEELLACYRTERRVKVGRGGHTTSLGDFIDVGRMSSSDLKRLSATFARFAARQLLAPAPDNICATRIAIERKQDLRLIAAVVDQMAMKPAIVDLDAKRHGDYLRGRVVPGERAVFLYDFLTTGYSPLACIAELRQRNIDVRLLVAFLVRDKDLNNLRDRCGKTGVELRVYCVQNESGDLVVEGANLEPTM